MMPNNSFHGWEFKVDFFKVDIAIQNKGPSENRRKAVLNSVASPCCLSVGFSQAWQLPAAAAEVPRRAPWCRHPPGSPAQRAFFWVSRCARLRSAKVSGGPAGPGSARAAHADGALAPGLWSAGSPAAAGPTARG